jgi:phosphohistidine phosphatase
MTDGSAPADAAPSAAASGPVLWLLRHGKAADPAGVADWDRPLTARGQAQATEAGAALARHAPQLTAVLASPRLRARTTAELAVEAHGTAPAPVLLDDLAHDFRAHALLAWVSPWLEAEAPAQLLVVGHNPSLAIVIQELTGDRSSLPTGTLVAIDLAGRRLLHRLVPTAH